MNQAAGEDQESHSGGGQPEAATEAERWPVAWLLLKCSSSGGSGSPHLVLPLRIDLGLPDYTLGVKEYDESMKLAWRAGQRFQMFFAGKKTSKGKQGQLFLPWHCTVYCTSKFLQD